MGKNHASQYANFGSLRIHNLVAHYKITPENRNQRRNVYEHKVKKVRIENKNESVQSSKG